MGAQDKVRGPSGFTRARMEPSPQRKLLSRRSRETADAITKGLETGYCENYLMMSGISPVEGPSRHACFGKQGERLFTRVGYCQGQCLPATKATIAG